MPEDETHGFTSEETEVVRSELDNLVSLWNTLIVHTTDGRATTSLHPPPALIGLYNSLFATIGDPTEELKNLLEPTPDVASAVAQLEGNIVAYGDMMFRFGQFCSQNGLLYSNLTQCRCGTVKDDELSKFLGQQ